MTSRQSHTSSPRFTLVLLLLTTLTGLAFGQQPTSTERKVENPIGVAEDEARSLRRILPPNVNIVVDAGAKSQSDNLELKSDRSEGQGDILIYYGKVEAHYTDITIFADKLTVNFATSDVVAEGEVYFEQQGQALVGDKIELNLKTKRGTIFSASGFTDRTPDGTRIVIDATRADKTGDDTFRLEHATITACQERIPKWSFTSKRARIRANDRATVYNALFRIKNVPIFFLPYASVPITKRDRASGFLLPSSGSSSIKGRTFHVGYFQTLGRSADILVRTDIYTKRGIGAGFDFRARTDENSRIAIGSFMVFDRLLGPKRDAAGNLLPDQGGSSFYADAVQYFKNGFVAVADVNITSNFDFRQVFAENILQAVSPEERSIVYVNRNWRSFSFNGSFGERSAFIANTIVKTRALPSLELTQRSTRFSESFPIYFSFDGALDGVRRTESAGFSDNFSFKTPSIVQRLDFAPRVTIPLRSFAGMTVTPSIGIRSTFYSDSLDPAVRQVTGQNLWRNYADFNVDFRPPSLAKVFRHSDGTPWFKHIIEPYAAYRRIVGIDEFDRTLRIDERDLVAETNEFEYGITNRFFVRRAGPNGETPQAHEVLELTLAQKYFFDPTFGEALEEGVRNQFFPINSLSGFSFGGTRRNVSPLNFKARYRPNQLVFADFRMNYDTKFHQLRDLIFGGGIARGIFSVSQSWYYTRRIMLDDLHSDPSSLPGNQLDISAFAGNPSRGPYGGFTVVYDLRDRTVEGFERDKRLINLTTTAGWAWDCCSVQVQNIVFNVGVRNENRIVFAFTLKGIGTFGTENIGQRRR
ncbi:MAG: LPS assembly protein LptD [Acidobacteriota bacterium]